jgi:hypothetical protein
MMSFIIIIPRTIQLGFEWSSLGHSLYMAFSSFIFVFGLSLTILPTILGCKTSIVNFLMDTEIFNFISKISFATYLIHNSFVKAWYVEQSFNIYYSQSSRFF